MLNPTSLLPIKEPVPLVGCDMGVLVEVRVLAGVLGSVLASRPVFVGVFAVEVGVFAGEGLSSMSLGLDTLRPPPMYIKTHLECCALDNKLVRGDNLA